MLDFESLQALRMVFMAGKDHNEVDYRQLTEEQQRLQKQELIDVAMEYLITHNVSVKQFQKKELKEATERVKNLLENIKRLHPKKRVIPQASNQRTILQIPEVSQRPSNQETPKNSNRPQIQNSESNPHLNIVQNQNSNLSTVNQKSVQQAKAGDEPENRGVNIAAFEPEGSR